MTRPRLLFATSLATGLAVQLAAHAALPACPAADGGTMAYDIVRGGNVIGRHTVQFSHRGADLVVNITVEANLFALGVRVYHYEHTGREVWRDGRMVGMETHTKDDGDTKQVQVTLDPVRNAWSGTAGPAAITGPLMASSFWNSQTTQQTRFIDDETGAVNPVKVTAAGQETLTVGGKPVPASKYDLVGTMSGSVWYDGNGCWVRALFKSPLDGSMVDVRARSSAVQGALP